MSVYHWVGVPFLALTLLAAGHCDADAVEPGAPTHLIDKQFMTLVAVRKALDAPATAELSLTKSNIEDLKSYYGSEDAKLIWVNGRGLNEKAEDGLKTAFARADTFGLNRYEYSMPKLTNGDSAGNLAVAELRLSLAALKYAIHAQAGRFDPKSLSRKYIDVNPQKPETASVLAGLAASRDKLADYLESYHPQHEQFRALRKKLIAVRTAKKTGTVRTRIPDGPSLGPDTSHAHIALIRKRLGIDLPEEAIAQGKGPDYYDVALEAAVRAYQEEKGLKPDGIIGRRTRQALNVGTIPVSEETIITNMERWRWMPRNLGKQYVFINIPEFKFRFISNGSILHQERIVTGSPKHKTPIFSDEMETIVFNPYWNVPRSILVNEIIPAEQRNPGYVDRNNIEVIWRGERTVDSFLVDWHTVNPNKLFLRQTPGPGNALGRVKFLFPNKHSVYMHDTPTKHLFNRPIRAYSHGCMRVRNPLKFAELLLSEQGWSRGRIEQTLASAYDEHVRLAEKLPIHISYFTAWVDDNEQILGYRDVYGYDQKVRAALKLDTRKSHYAANEKEFDVGERGLQN